MLSPYRYNSQAVGAMTSGKPLLVTGAGGSGTVTSVGLSAPDIFSVTGSPVIASGTLTFTPVDAGADKIVYWNDVAGKWQYLAIGANLSIFAGTLNAASSPDEITIDTTAINSGTAQRVLFQSSGNLVTESAAFVFSELMGDGTLAIGGTGGGSGGHITTGDITCGPGLGLLLRDPFPSTHVLNVVNNDPSMSAGRTLNINTNDASFDIQIGTNGFLIGEVRDEGTPLTSAPVINFVGAGVTAASAAGVYTVTIPGGGAATSIAIGNAVTGGGANRILYEDASQNLGAEAAATYDASTNTLQVDNVKTTTLAAVSTAIGLNSDLQLAENITVLLDAALSADGKWSGFGEAGTLGETVAFGAIVYLKAADSKWYNAKADVVGTSGNVKIGCCVVAGNANAATTVLLWGKVRADSLYPTLTVSAPVYISAATAGQITNTQPSATDNVIQVIGFGNTGDELYFRPSVDYMTHT